MFNIQKSEIESEKMQFLAVHDHHFAVVTHQLIGGAGHRHTSREQPHLQLAQVLFAAPVGVGNKRVDEDAPLRRVLERSFEFGAVETENDDFNALLRSLDPSHQRFNSIARLYQ